ncbi:hypothetical protein [Leucobacter chromiiresistens]|uniref:Uncharacterized protein n=1 Tax=Leucobacter chromiiresistens TaxID=1079994 RepID=A0A1H0Z4R1_9MICO|nr:hypothetical protein [Leucobacter chromiiresistens]SDQ22425.1 hypothetical protein SAMN04488565_1447 [Leucobacter chromiiresistens]
MAVGYRAILRLNDQDDAVSTVEDQLRLWLRDKSRGRGADLEVVDWQGPGTHRLGRRSELHVIHDDHAQDSSRRRLYRLIETNPHGRWIVSLYAASLPTARSDRQTIVIETDLADADHDTSLRKVAPPKVVRNLLSAVDVHDGLTPLTGQPIVIRPGDVERVFAAIADADRTASVIVAGSIDRAHDEAWKGAIASLTAQSIGIAATFVVYADAMVELNDLLPDGHQIERGRVRTFLPNVQLNDPSDSVRHKWLGPATFARSLRGQKVGRPLQIRHAEATRRRIVEMELPSDVRRMIDLLRRAEVGMVRNERVATIVAASLRKEALSPTTRVEHADEPQPQSGLPPLDVPQETTTQVAGTSLAVSGWQRAANAVRRWLGLESPAPNHIDELDTFIESKVAEVRVAEEQLQEAAEVEEDLKVEAARLRRRLDDLELDLIQAEIEGADSHREIQVLRQRLARTGHAESAYVEPEEEVWKAPGSIEELVARITPGEKQHVALERVEFTGNPDIALEIDRRYVSGLYSTSVWEFVRVLYDYAEARATGEFSGSVHMYLGDDRVEGTKCSPKKHAGTESETVLNNTKWRSERLLPVPQEVDPSGKILMAAHFKPAHRDTFAPRVHYYDDVSGTGKIYVGYIGKHLTNTKS